MPIKRGVFTINKISMPNGLFKSLRFLWFVCFFVLTIAFFLLFSFIIHKTYENESLEQKKNYTVNQCTILLNQLVKSGFFNGNDTLNLENQIDQLATLLDGRIMVVDSNYQIISDTYQINRGNYLVSENVIKAMTGKMGESEHLFIRDGYIECYIPVGKAGIVTESNALNTEEEKLGQKEKEEQIGLMVVYASVKDTYTLLSEVSRQTVPLIVLFTFCVLVIAVIFVVILSGHFRELLHGVDEVAEGQTGEPLTVTGFTELKDLAESFNAAVARLDKLEESRQEFVSNVSHELKAPLTSMKVLADSINSMGDEAPKELYQEFMGDITNEIERETKIINDLLSLVKMDKSSADLNIESVNINELIEQILKRLQPIAEKQQVEVVLESFRPVTAEVDEVKLSLAITNLVENAIKYNKNDGEGWVHVSLNADHQYFYLKVEDSGMGIPEESLEHIYERFYRVDKSHSREIGGTGLGLAITRNSILMHRGAIKVHSMLGEGTTFDVRVPLNYIA